jgi:hypothetical protein
VAFGGAAAVVAEAFGHGGFRDAVPDHGTAGELEGIADGGGHLLLLVSVPVHLVRLQTKCTVTEMGVLLQFGAFLSQSGHVRNTWLGWIIAAFKPTGCPSCLALPEPSFPAFLIM